MRSLSSLLEIADDYDGFLLDLWGVIHDGQSLYPGVRERIGALKEAGNCKACHTEFRVMN